MIRAHMATYPKRLGSLEQAVRSVAQQVDRLYLVLNEYTEIPEGIASIENVEPIIPEEDLKDVGKFLTVPKDDDLVLLVDDDLIYPPDYAETLVSSAERIGLDNAVFGYHGSIYNDVAGKGAMGRRMFGFRQNVQTTICVDQLGTGAVLALGKNVAPLAFMQGSQKFVDVRYAKWLSAKGIDSWCLAHRRNFIGEIAPATSRTETIHSSFTRRSPHYVIAEILEFAGKGAKVGTTLGGLGL